MRFFEYLIRLIYRIPLPAKFKRQPADAELTMGKSLEQFSSMELHQASNEIINYFKRS